MKALSLNNLEILEYQKNRYPYLMIDVAEEVVPGKFAKGFKNLSSNDWFFKCHFPGDPNMPGLLQIEAMVQMSALVILTLPKNKGKIMYISKLKKATFNYNRAEAYSIKGKHSIARKFYTTSKSHCEDALEILQEIVNHDAG